MASAGAIAGARHHLHNETATQSQGINHENYMTSSVSKGSTLTRKTTGVLSTSKGILSNIKKKITGDGKNEEKMFSAKNLASAKAMEEARRSKELSEMIVRRSPVQTLVECAAFNYTVGACILFNGILIGIEADYEFSPEDLEWKITLALNYLFTITFTTELLLKIYAYGTGFFLGSERAWNVFDSVLVGLSFTEMFILPSLGDDSDLQQMSALRLLRLLRVVRLLRLMRIFRQLWLFIIGLYNAMNIVIWALLLIVLVVYMSAIFCTNQFKSLCQNDPEMYEKWHSVSASMFTLFQITTGDSWASNIVRPIIKVQPEMSIFFVLFVCLTQFAFLNVVVAVIVENVLKEAETSDEEIRRKADEELKDAFRNMYNAFDAMDRDHDGALTREEFSRGLHCGNALSYLQKADISLEDAEELFDIVDVDRSGALTLDEFINGCMKGRGTAKAKDTLAISCGIEKVELTLNQVVERLQKLDKATGDGGAISSRLDKLETKLKFINNSCIVTVGLDECGDPTHEAQMPPEKVPAKSDSERYVDTSDPRLTQLGEIAMASKNVGNVDALQTLALNLQKADAQWSQVRTSVLDVATTGNVEEAVKAAGEMANGVMQLVGSLLSHHKTLETPLVQVPNGVNTREKL